MSHPVIWPKHTFFYPLGNTPPVCLTQELAPEEPANILLLGCGDPRSILYTLHSGLKLPGKTRPLDFTCCDAEPAVLARNALLFTLVIDGYTAEEIWPIFFHFKISPKSMTLLVSQCEKLIAVDFQTPSSPYSKWLRICSYDTLRCMRDHWKLYAKAKGFTKKKNQSLLSGFASRGKTVSENYTASRSAGPFWKKAKDIVEEHTRYYWKTGVVSRSSCEVASATAVNPTFVYSLAGEGCAVHYGTYPLQCFHLAEAYATSPAIAGKKITERDLVAVSVAQFRQWCQVFKADVLGGSVTIRLFAGDALAFCQTLRHVRETSSLSASLYTSAWSGQELILDGGDYAPQTPPRAPTTFNVIDTSNITDHVGLLNVLIVTIPLLKHSPSATLYTETLRVTESELEKRLFMDIPTAAILLGISPAGCVSNFSSTSNTHEIELHHYLKDQQYQQYHERISWKVPYLGDPAALDSHLGDPLHPSFEPQELTKVLFDVYYKMFSNEDVCLLQNTKKLLGLLGKGGLMNYHRSSLVALLKIVKSRVRTDWTTTMESFFDLLHSDRKLFAGSNGYQELCCQLYMKGVYCVDALGPDAAKLTGMYHSRGIFAKWKHVPNVVCLVVEVPRSNIWILEDMDPRGIGSPMLECGFRGSTFYNFYSCIQFTFGSISIRGSEQDTCVIIKEDAAGLFGTSPLIFSVWIPAFTLSLDPFSSHISLDLHATPATSELTPKLGPALSLFSCNLTDRKYIHVVPARPHRAAELDSLKAAWPHPPHATSHKVSIICKDATVTGMCARWDVGDVTILPTAEITQKQTSPCTIMVSVGQTMKQNLIYPFPINGDRAKLRIARKSRWIEVTAPVLWPYSPERFFPQQFSPLISKGQPLQLWNIHRLNFSALPALDICRHHNYDWVSPHVSTAHSGREVKLQSKKDNLEVLPLIKKTLHQLLVNTAKPNTPRIYGLIDPSNGGFYTIFFINKLHLDLAAYTLVADAYILPITGPLMERYGQRIAELTDGKTTASSSHGVEVVSAWKQLIPALAERCRTWSHKETCEYVKTGKVPLSVDIYENPLCSCGEGIDTSTQSFVKDWNELTPLMTRVALSPLFAVSYLERIDGPTSDISTLLEMTERITTNGAAANIGSKCALCGKSASGMVKLLNCSRCKQTNYCGRDCQVRHWKEHKQTCRVA